MDSLREMMHTWMAGCRVPGAGAEEQRDAPLTRTQTRARAESERIKTRFVHIFLFESVIYFS